jgi:two-component system, LuxR family, sensor kinase FixL
MQGREWFDAIIDSAILLDKNGKVIDWNQGATTLFGYTSQETKGRSINLIYDRSYPFPKIIHDIHSQAKEWWQETPVLHKNGAVHICKSSLSPIHLKDQTKIMALLIHQNLTDNLLKAKQIASQYLQMGSLLCNTIQKLEQCEKRLRESELRFHLLAQNATDIISRHAPDGSYLYISPACQATLGFDPDNLIGKTIFKYIHHDDINKVKRVFQNKRVKNNQKPLNYRMKRKDGDYRWLESNLRLILDEKSKQLSEIQLATRDITDRILDKKARLRGQQLAHVYRLSTMEEMASGLAHEICQPLAALINYTRGCVHHLQKNGYDKNQLLSMMAKAVSQAERAGEIIQRLKNFFCKGQLIKTPCKINHVIREAVNLNKSAFAACNAKVNFSFDKNLPFIHIDKIHIQQVILNLLQNAIEAMQESHCKEKKVHIQTRLTHANHIEITVSDTGPGFNKDMMQDVFKPFYTTKAHGRGMGLAICRSIIEAHGGHFTINANTQHASWIRFSLPISM